MESGCKFCGKALMVRWCQQVTCGRFLDVPITEHTGFVQFYLEHANSFIRILHRDGCLCKECGRVLALKSLTNPCPVCLRNDPYTILKRFEQSDKDALRAELGYASAVKWRTFHEDAGLVPGKEWEGYTLELLGIELSRFSDCVISGEGLKVYEALGLASEENGSVLLKRSQMFPFSCIPDVADADLIIKLCRIRARFEGSPLYSEMRAHPYGVRRVAIHGLEHKHTTKDRERAVKGLDLIRAAAKKLGRKKGTRFYSESEFWKRAPAVYRSFYDREGEHPSGVQLAAEMYLSKSALYEHMKEYRVKGMKEIRAIAEL